MSAVKLRHKRSARAAWRLAHNHGVNYANSLIWVLMREVRKFHNHR